MKAPLLFALLLLVLSAPARAESIRTPAGERTYAVHRPQGAPAGPLPLVVVLHGALGSGEQAEKAYGWNALADAHGFLVAYPDGVRRTWNAGGGCCGPAWEQPSDDVGFLDALIADLVGGGRADPRRVYLAGISNGGAMAYRYACEGAAPVAAIGVVSGAMSLACDRPRPVSVMAIHGLDDRTIPFAGGAGRRDRAASVSWPAMEASLAPFRTANGCGEPASASRDVVETTRWLCAEGREVMLLTIAGAGHQWPGSRPQRRLAARLLDLDPPSNALDATAALWDFFRVRAAE